MTTLVSGPEIVCSSAAQLTATPNTTMLSGSIAYVITFGAYFALQATGPAPDGATVLAAADGRVWTRVLSGVQEAAQAQALWVIDPANSTAAASDENPGTLLLPLLSVGEVARRMGTSFPTLKQATTIQWLSSGTAADPFTLQPALSGAGALTLQGTPTVATTTTIGVFTPQNRAAGTPATITASGVASWTVGQCIVDTTSNAIFWVVADLGGGVAQITLPVSNALGFNPAPVTIANGETIQLQTLQSVFADILATQTGIGPTINRLALSVASPATSFIALQAPILNACRIFGCFVTAYGTPSAAVRFSACLGLANSGASPIQGVTFQITAGGMLGSFGQYPGPGICTIDGDALMLGASHFGGTPGGTLRIAAAYFANPIINQGPTTNFVTIASATYGPSGRPVIWGPTVWNVAGGAQFTVAGGATAVQLFLNTGGLQLDGVAAGSTFTVGTGLWSAGTVALTPAAVDADGMLTNPKTNSRIHT
jgi:hypothetical protein